MLFSITRAGTDIIPKVKFYSITCLLTATVLLFIFLRCNLEGPFLHTAKEHGLPTLVVVSDKSVEGAGFGHRFRKLMQNRLNWEYLRDGVSLQKEYDTCVVLGKGIESDNLPHAKYYIIVNPTILPKERIKEIGNAKAVRVICGDMIDPIILSSWRSQINVKTDVIKNSGYHIPELEKIILDCVSEFIHKKGSQW